MWLLLTVVIFSCSRRISAKYNNILLNPLLVSMLLMGLILYITNTDYQVYFNDNQLLHQCLNLAVVSLAIPLYKQLPFIIHRWKLLLFSSLFASSFVILLTVISCLFFGFDSHIIAVIIPKSVTMPIALSITNALGGEAALTVLMVVVSSWVGVLAAYPLFTLFGISKTLAKGIAIGSVSHILGTAKAAQVNEADAAVSTIAFILCGIFTAFLGPIIFNILFV